MTHHISTVVKAAILFVSICLVVLSPLPVAGSSRQAIGATITVNTLVDEYDTSPNSTCSLREAITSANTDSAFGGCVKGDGTDTIKFLDLPGSPDTFYLTRTGPAWEGANLTGDLNIKDSVIIEGVSEEETIIDASGLGDRVIYLDILVNVNLSDLTLQNGHAPDGDPGGVGLTAEDGEDGGGIYSSQNDLVLSHVTMAGMRAGDGGAGYSPAISTVTAGDGGPGGNGGAIYAMDSTITIN
ncbi:MAG: CSLREA domain-containing protein, partial [Anaerolineaceae bacterium]